MRALLVLIALVGCHTPARTTLQTGSLAGPGPRIRWTRVEAPADVPAEPPKPGSYRIHLIDVGTGLSILIQGADFAMLYDAGTNDRDEQPSRVLAYLARALGPSGDDLCGAPGDRKPLPVLVLSHPHFDHASAMDLVVHCYAVRDDYDSGRASEAKFFGALQDALARSPETKQHAAVEGDVVQLGAGARFTVLHANAKATRDMNENSVVLAVELGGVRLLLVGDAPSGARADPSMPAGEVEQYLIDHHVAELRSDILQVGHHGSKTSSRRAFLDAVHPKLALISSGPKVYGHTVLPDREVVEELGKVGAKVLRTDERDGACPLHQRIGAADGPGGCDTYIISIGSK